MPVMDGWGLLDIIHEADFDKKIEIIMALRPWIKVIRIRQPRIQNN
jgi:hypothetical protein